MSRVFVCDLDGVLINSDIRFAKKWSEILGVPIHPDDFTNWDMTMALGVDPTLAKRFWDETWLVPAKPYPEASAFIHAVKELGFRLVVLTSRPAGFGKAAVLFDVGTLAVDEVIICDTGCASGKLAKERKSDYINDIPGAEFFLDDFIGNVVDAKLHCQTLREVLLFDRPWNKSKDIIGYTRVYSYADVLRRLNS